LTNLAATVHPKSICHVVGTRPHFMKLSPVLNALGNAGIKNEVLHTGQHWDESLSGTFLEELGIAVSKTFVVTPGGHGVQTASMMIELEKYWLSLARLPSVVFVYGDTNSTLAAALVAAKLDIPLAHIEGGVRAEKLERHMPEEINRKLTDDLSTWIYAPTAGCVDNLVREGFSKERVVFVGDVMLDQVRLQKERLKATQPNSTQSTPIVVATVHRAENTNEPDRLNSILAQLQKLSKDFRIRFFVHPRTKKHLQQFDAYNELSSNIDLLDPIGHAEMIGEINRCSFVVSDSGGLPKEAAFLGKQSVILRRQAVWNELVDQGFAVLADPKDIDSIEAAVGVLMNREPPKQGLEGFGDGYTANAIANHIVRSATWL
jgi:UDP-GlcNAc3NAcA epimerase